MKPLKKNSPGTANAGAMDATTSVNQTTVSFKPCSCKSADGQFQTQDGIATQRNAALALLTDPTQRLTRKAGSFLGQLCADPTQLTDSQADWLNRLLDRAGLPPFAGEDDHA